MVDWLKIRNEYISTDVSTRKLAEKYGVSASSVLKHSAKEKWPELKKAQVIKITSKVNQKTAEKAADIEVNRVARLMKLGEREAEIIDRILTKMESEAASPYELKVAVQATRELMQLYRGEGTRTEDDVLHKYLDEMERARVE